MVRQLIWISTKETTPFARPLYTSKAIRWIHSHTHTSALQSYDTITCVRIHQLTPNCLLCCLFHHWKTKRLHLELMTVLLIVSVCFVYVLDGFSLWMVHYSANRCRHPAGTARPYIWCVHDSLYSIKPMEFSIRFTRCTQFGHIKFKTKVNNHLIDCFVVS